MVNKKKVSTKLCIILLCTIFGLAGCDGAENETTRQAEGGAETFFSASDNKGSDTVTDDSQEDVSGPTADEEKGKLILRRTERDYTNNVIYHIYEYEHNSDGSVIEKKCSPDGTVQSITKYDQNRNMVEYIRCDDNGNYVEVSQFMLEPAAISSLAASSAFTCSMENVESQY